MCLDLFILPNNHCQKIIGCHYFAKCTPSNFTLGALGKSGFSKGVAIRKSLGTTALRGRPQRGRLVKCVHLQTRGDVRKVELFIIPVCFAAALHGCYLTINCKLLFILFNVCHRIYWLALIGLQRSGFQGEVVYMNYLLILTLL